MVIKHYKGQDIKFDATNDTFYCDIARSNELKILMRALDAHSFLRNIEDVPYVYVNIDNGKHDFRFIGQFNQHVFFWSDDLKRIVISKQEKGKIFYKFKEEESDIYVRRMSQCKKKIAELEAEFKICEENLGRIVVY